VKNEFPYGIDFYGAKPKFPMEKLYGAGYSCTVFLFLVFFPYCHYNGYDG
jgi:hypothetical protein